MPEISIEIAQPSDVDAIVRLLRAQLLEHEINTATDALREVARAVTSNAQLGFILLALANVEHVGVAFAAAHMSAEHGGVVGWLEELYVSPEWRGRGVGSRLLVEVTARAEQLGWKALELEVVQGHERTVPLYQRHQFRPTARTRFTRKFD